MPVGHVQLPDVIYPIDGIRLGVTQAGVRYQHRDDLTVIAIEQGHTALVTTSNAFCAAPVLISREHVSHADAKVRYLLINTGNANAGTGDDGMTAAMHTCQALADKTDVPVHAVLPFSTGVIGEPLNADAIVAGLDKALATLSADNWAAAANAICTTDTVAKVASEQVQVDDVQYHVTGIAKGAGMIRPNMATMLGFVATDADIAPPLLKQMLKQLVDVSFNRITVDGDMSTNDCCTLTATGTAWQQLASQKSVAGQIDSTEHPHYAKLYETLKNVFVRLAQLIVRDGEGATKFITVTVSGGHNQQECCDVAYAVAQSPLVKTAFFASDPNWGRILAAVGYAGLADLDTTRISVHLDELCICQRGKRATDYLEAQGQAVMNKPEIVIHIDLGRGSATDTVYTCDLSYDYVKINADYRS